MTFTIPGEPVGKARPRVVRNGGRVHTYTPQKTADYERRVRSEYLAAGGKHYGKQAIGITIDAYFQVPKSDSRQMRQDKLDDRIRPTKKPDFDNIGKIVADSLNGIAYDDDSQIVVAIVRKFYSETPYVKVTIMTL